MKIIIVNGPPRSGKGTLVSLLLDTLPNAAYCSFKEPLYKAMMSKYFLSRDELMTFVDGELKDTPTQRFEGLSPRAALIELDKQIKLEHGEMAIATEVINTILDDDERYKTTYIFPDGGVGGEVAFVEQVLKHYGLLDLTVVQVRKKGCDFKNDTRSYLPNPSFVIDNNVDETGKKRGTHMFEQFIQNYKFY